jgi:hypothetical protein
MPTIPTVNAAPNIHLFMLPIIPPFQAERFTGPPRLAPFWELDSCRPLGLPVLPLQTRWAQKVVRNFSACAVSKGEFLALVKFSAVAHMRPFSGV